MKQTLTVVIITKNEEHILPGAIRSVEWADEIIVVDCGSDDKTVAVAKKYTKNVFVKTWSGFATQKNYGIDRAKSNWILILDADERVSKELHVEIQQVLNAQQSEIVAYDLPFRNFFLGREMLHGGWLGETHIRLFRKGKARYKAQEIHEYLEIKGAVKKLLGSVLHFSHRDIASNLLKTRQYAIIQSKYEYERGMPLVTRKSLFLAIVEHFWNRFIKLQGYKDGMEGFVEATYQAFSQIFVIQTMLWERQRGKSVEAIYDELERKLMGWSAISLPKHKKKKQKALHQKRKTPRS